LPTPLQGRNAALIVTFTDNVPGDRVIRLTLNGQKLAFRDDGRGADQRAGDGRFSAPFTVRLDSLQAQQTRLLAAARRGIRPVVFREREPLPRPLPDTSLVIPPSVDELIRLLRERQFVIPRSITPRPGRIFPVIPFTPVDPATVSYPGSLLINDPQVMSDTTRTWNVCTRTGDTLGVWSFRHAVTEMANTPVTGITPEHFVRRWLKRWELNLTVNDVASPSRPGMVSFINDWQTASGGANVPLDLNKAPFRLLAIVNRIDLRENLTYGGGSAGEGRLVFGAVNPSTCQPLLFTVILEYGIHKTGCPGLKGWAQQWMNLSHFTIGSESYDSALAVITEQFVGRNTNPAQLPNRSSLNQLRTNEILSGPWQLREFHLAGEDVDIGHLRQVVVKQTPRDELNAQQIVADYIARDHVQIGNGTNVVPTEFSPPPAPPVDPFLGPQSNAPPVPGGFWDGPPPPPSTSVDSLYREKFSLNTCNGCHTTETATGFTHIKPQVNPGTAGSLSAFLMGIDNVFDPAGEKDPANPTATKKRTFNEPLRRQQSIADVLGQSCLQQILFRPLRAVH